MRLRISLLILVGLVWGVAAAAASDHGHKKLGKEGEVVLTQETQIGDYVLQPGTYSVRHREKGTNHWVEFELQPEEELNTAFREWGMKSLGEVVARVPCTLEHMKSPANRTALLAGADGRQIARMEIKGESAAHLF